MADHALSGETIFPSTNNVGSGKKMSEANLSDLVDALTGGNHVISGFTAPDSSVDLTLEVAAGEAIISGRRVYIATATTITCDANETNYVFLRLTKDGLGNVVGAVLTVQTTSVPPADSVRIRTVVADEDSITATIDARPFLSSPYNVTTFGAVGDARTDSTAGLQAAIDAAEAAGEEVYVPPGIYLTNELTIESSMRLTLAPGATLKLISGADSRLLYITGDDVTITGGAFDGNKAGQSVYWPAMHVTADRFTAKGCEVANSASYGIWIKGGDYARILNCRVHDSRSVGIFAEPDETAGGAQYLLVQGCHVFDVGVEATEGGIKVHGDPTGAGVYSVGTRIIGNVVQNPAQIAIEAYGLGQRAMIAQNVCTGGTMGISADRSNYTTITGNCIEQPSVFGIELASSQHCTIIGNTVECANQDSAIGILTDNTSPFPTNNVIAGNNIRFVNRGIQLGSGSNGTTISHNTITTYQTYGIEVQASDYIAIVGNVIMDGGNKAIILDNANEVQISGNLANDAAQHGILMYQHDAGTVNRINIVGNHLTSTNVPIGTQGAPSTYVSEHNMTA